MKLYMNPASPNCRKVLATIKQLGLEVEQVTMNFEKGDLKTPEYLVINPNGKVPTLTDGELKLWESNAICAYLCDKVASRLWPTGARRYDVMRWMAWEGAHFSKAAGDITFQRVFKPMMGLGNSDEAVVEHATQDFLRFGAVLNGKLSGRTFLVGDSLTIADFVVASALTYEKQAGLPIDNFGNIRRWLANLNEIPAWRDTAPKL